jgi:hypothetical protein
MGFAQVVILVLLVGILLLAAIFMLRQPIDKMAQANVDDKKKRLMEAKAKLDYETLASEIRIGLELTTRRLNYLENDIHRLKTKTQAILGVPMEELVSFPSKRSRDLDMAILKSDTFARNWSGLVNAHIFPVDIRLKFATLEYIRTRLETETLLPEDKNTLTRLGYWSATRQEFTQYQIRNLRELAEILQMNQLYENLKKIEEERSFSNENSDYQTF